MRKTFTKNNYITSTNTRSDMLIKVDSLTYKQNKTKQNKKHVKK